jgi:hypothetical protein
MVPYDDHTPLGRNEDQKVRNTLFQKLTEYYVKISVCSLVEQIESSEKRFNQLPVDGVEVS